MLDTPTFRPFPANDKLLSVRSTLGSSSKEKLSSIGWVFCNATVGHNHSTFRTQINQFDALLEARFNSSKES